MYTSNSRHLKGESVIYHRESMKQKLENERSPPPLRERMSLTPPHPPGPGASPAQVSKQRCVTSDKKDRSDG
ncbi:hypothetical protein PBY51_004956 [Eleginops maclovinus]|uniref:Uncharacterized protein n=1 Tax=Eleginops maclovinus TaxID=56733 RepID=A0AAN7X4J5_ELEMC|nr:hypothetical protein PBY51_004956 [Eleginops maclovinus]